MKNIIASILVVVGSITLLHQKATAQSRYNLDYRYDAVGNRTNKNLRVNLVEEDWQPKDTSVTPPMPEANKNPENTTDNKDALSTEIRPNVYPNPTVNELHIDFINTNMLLKNEQYEIAIYDAKYTRCITKKSSFGKEVLDLTTLAAGNYMLIINANGKQYKYQIQKLN